MVISDVKKRSAEDELRDLRATLGYLKPEQIEQAECWAPYFGNNDSVVDDEYDLGALAEFGDKHAENELNQRELARALGELVSTAARIIKDKTVDEDGGEPTLAKALSRFLDIAPSFWNVRYVTPSDPAEAPATPPADADSLGAGNGPGIDPQAPSTGNVGSD